MSRSVFVAIVIIMIVSFQEAFALKCWRCSSDSSNGGFCDEPFNEALVSEQQKRWSYVECVDPPASYGETKTVVCKKAVSLIDDKRVVTRSCYWEYVDASKNECLYFNRPSYVKTIFCETCQTDGCNGDKVDGIQSGSTQHVSLPLLVVIQIIVVKILLL